MNERTANHRTANHRCHRRFALAAAIAVVALYAGSLLLPAYRNESIALLPWLLIAACPLMHLLMHRGHRHADSAGHSVAAASTGSARTDIRGPGSTTSMLVLAVLLATAAAMPPAQAAASEQAIPLRDGGRIVLRDDGSTDHFDASGNAVAMKDGEVMVAGDGTRVMMKGGSLWRQIVETGARAFTEASTLRPVILDGAATASPRAARAATAAPNAASARWQ